MMECISLCKLAKVCISLYVRVCTMHCMYLGMEKIRANCGRPDRFAGLTRLGPMKVGRRPGFFPRCASRCGENCERCRLAWPQLSKVWVELGLWDAISNCFVIKALAVKCS